MVMGGAGNVAGAAGAGAGLVEGLMHGFEHDRILTLADIIVGAPDGDFAFAAGAREGGLRESALNALEIGEDAIAAFLLQRRHGGLEMGSVGKRHCADACYCVEQTRGDLIAYGTRPFMQFVTY